MQLKNKINQFASKAFFVIAIFALVFGVIPTNLKTAKAAAPVVSLTINPDGGFSNYPPGNNYSVNITWSSSGAVRCESSGQDVNGTWGYNHDIGLSGTKSEIASGDGSSVFIVTCFSGTGEKTQVMRQTYAYNPAQSGMCAQFPELVRSNAHIYVQNGTTGENVTMDSVSSGGVIPDIPVAIGDPILIVYHTSTNSDTPNDTNFYSPNAYRYDTSTTNQSMNRDGAFYVDSATVNSGNIEVSVKDCNQGAAVYVHMVPRPAKDFSLVCTPASVTMAQESSTSFNLVTSPISGFDQPVTFAAPTFSPSTGTLPSVTYSNNGKVPDAVTTANVTTTSSTTPGTYNITFSGTGGGITHTCQVQLVLARNGGYTLTVTPATNEVMKANQAVYKVMASCYGVYGTITNLQVTLPSAFPGLTYTLTTPSAPYTPINYVSCYDYNGARLVIDHTDSIPANKLSTPQLQIPGVISVTGTAQ